jgi:hypothetical protein
MDFDSGRSENTLINETDLGSYKVPTMRDVAIAAVFLFQPFHWWLMENLA